MNFKIYSRKMLDEMMDNFLVNHRKIKEEYLQEIAKKMMEELFKESLIAGKGCHYGKVGFTEPILLIKTKPSLTDPVDQNNTNSVDQNKLCIDRRTNTKKHRHKHTDTHRHRHTHKKPSKPADQNKAYRSC